MPFNWSRVLAKRTFERADLMDFKYILFEVEGSVGSSPSTFGKAEPD